MNTLKIGTSVLLFIIFISARAVIGSDSPIEEIECPNLKSVEDFARCALKKHPDGVRAKDATDEGELLESAASQWLNPELSGRGLWGKSYGDDIFNSEINLTQTLELGGKRGARIDRALAEKRQLEALALSQRETVYIQTIKSLFRARQLDQENKTLEEALQTFSRIERQFKARPRLAPEQQVSLGVFELAASDYRIKKNGVEAQVQEAQQYLEIALGKENIPKIEALPQFKRSWPKLTLAGLPVGGSELKQAEAEVQLAQAEYSLAKSESWPDFKLGPSYTYESQGGIIVQTIGVNLSFPLPLFSWNGGGRAATSQKSFRAERNLSLKKKELEFELRALVDQYKRATLSLSGSVSAAEIEKKHRNVESLFDRGVISSSLVIESHRQIYDFTKDLNEHELLALDSILKIWAHQDRLFEEKL